MRKARRMKGRSAVAAMALATLGIGVSVAGAAADDLDKKFSRDGWTAINSGGAEVANALAIQPDGKIVVVGGTSVNDDAAVYRLKKNGGLDKTFDGDGAKGIDSGGAESGFATAVQPDGKIVVVGATTVGQDAAVYRLNSNGSLDRTFNGDGAMGINSGGLEIGRAVALQPDGKIVVVGSTSVGDNAAVYRVNPNGTLDPTFDGDGAKGIDSGAVEVGAAVALQPDGKIVVVGSTTVGGNVAVYRLNPSGSLDPTFDGDGAKGIDSGGFEDGFAVAIQPDGKIVVVGQTSVGNNAAVYRLNPNGSLDSSFDGDGAKGLDSGGDEFGFATAIQPNGKILVAGYTSDGDDAVLYRLNPNGSLDTRFGDQGERTLDVGDLQVAFAMALQSDGKIVVGGRTSDFLSSDALVARLKGGR
jgi:uncharacterized delta-60 repeat protein